MYSTVVCADGEGRGGGTGLNRFAAGFLVKKDIAPIVVSVSISIIVIWVLHIVFVLVSWHCWSVKRGDLIMVFGGGRKDW